MSADEQTMLIAGIGYLVVVAIWVLTLHARAKTMLRTLSEIVDPALWQSLGSPDTIKAAMQDPGRRWHKFIKSGEYKTQFNGDAIGMVDDYRRRFKTMLLICAGAGLLLLYRIWSVLGP